MQAAFCFSDDLQSTAANLSCLSNRLQPLNLLQSAPSPVGEGWGEGILRIAATFHNTLTAQNTSLAACCPLSSSLPRKRGRVAVGAKGSARKTGCAGCFLFFRRPTSTAVNPSCLSNRQNRQIRCNLLPPPWRRAGERAFSQIAATFPNTLTAHTSLAACCPLSNSLPRERGRGGSWN